MMEFFKANPAALMDALPTPPGSDYDNASVKGDPKSAKRGYNKVPNFNSSF